MLRFLRSQFSPEQARPDDLTDFFNYRQTVRSGFPYGACAIGVDNILSLVAIGTQQGEILVLGGPHAMWRSVVPAKSAIGYIYFAHGTGYFMVLCQDQSFHRFKISGSTLEYEAIQPETRLKRITSCEMYQKTDLSDSRLLIGTMTGNVFSIKMDTCELTEFILYEDTMLPTLPLESRSNHSIDAISVNPKEPRQVLLVIDQKIVLLYDINVHEVFRVYLQLSPVMHLSWCGDGITFMVAHQDGGFSKWSTRQERPLETSNILFGPFPCTPVNKIFGVSTNVGDTVIFSGGLPRASYGDRYTITVKRGPRVSVFDFSSPALDFAVIPESTDHKADDHYKGGYLVILCEQELLMLDLGDKNWREIPLPYLYSLHFSQITTSTLCAEVEEHVWKDIHKASERQFSQDRYSKRAWPFTAGNSSRQRQTNVAFEGCRQLLVTGHENGLVRLWAAGDLSLRLLLSIKTPREFHGFKDEETKQENGLRDSMYDSDNSSEGNPTSEWPPFVKIGEYDPFCDDHRLAVQKVAFDASSGLLAVGGRGGHVLVFHLTDQTRTLTPHCVDPPLIPNDKVPVHIGRLQPMRTRQDSMDYEPGYQAYAPEGSDSSVMVQLRPCTAITAMAILSSRGLVACGNEFGFLVVDIKSKQAIVNCSLCSGQDLIEAGALDDALSRFKSMKKSIRQSFRRKKKTPAPGTNATINENENSGPTNNSGSPVRVNHAEHNDSDDEDVVRPVERKIEARAERATPEQPTWLIRVLSFSKASMLSSTTASDCLWVGSNGGRILCYAIAPRERPEDACRLVKEIRMEHAAPIINIEVQTDPFTKSSAGSNRLIVFTEEQIRAFSLPHLKHTRYKYKLTALEGERIRKAALVKLVSSTDGHLDELFALVLTNQGNAMLFSLAHPRKKISANVIKVTDILGMTSCILSPSGELLFLRSGGSEYQRATISKSTPDWISPFTKDSFPPSQ